MAKLRYDIKQKIIEIAGTCFHYNKNFYDFLESCGVGKNHYLRYEGETGKYNKMRNILSDLEDRGEDDILKNIQSSIYRLKTAPDKNVPDIKLAQKNIDEFKEMCGKDIIREELEKEKFKDELKIRQRETLKQKNFSDKREELKNSFLKLFSDASNKQKRGYELEKLVYNLFLLNEIEFNPSYKSKNEQIDGCFNFDKFPYLVETRWVEEVINQGELAVFDKKIDKKLQSTRGFFIAINGFDKNAIDAFTSNKPRLILMDGDDLLLILEGSVNLKDGLKAKIDSAIKDGNIFYKLRSLL